MAAEIKLGHLHTLVLAQALHECKQICNVCKESVLRDFTSAFYGLAPEVFLMRYPTLCRGGFPQLSLQRPDVELWLYQHFNEFVSPAGLHISAQAQIWFALKGSRPDRNRKFDTDKVGLLRQRRIRRQVVQIGERCSCADLPVHQMDRPEQLYSHLMDLTW